jgi:hypothetical protein
VGPRSARRRLGVLLSLFLVEWLAVITFSETKFEWYTGPMLPALALLLALGVGAAYTSAQAWLPAWVQRAWWRPLLGGALAVGLVAIPVGRAFYWIKQERSGYQVWGQYRAYSAYLRDYQPAKKPAHILAYYDDNYFGSLHFYQQTLGTRGLHLRCCGPDSLPQRLVPGAQVLVCLPDLRQRLLQRYAVRLVNQRETCTLYEVTGPSASQPIVK